MSTEQQVTDQTVIDKVKDTVEKLDGFSLYEDSIHEDGNHLLCIARKGIDKFLLVIPEDGKNTDTEFSGETLDAGSATILKCYLSHKNAEVLRSKFDFTNAVLVGKTDSYGFGDRLGNAGPAHLRAVKGTGFKPVLAQQSIRELERTNRTPADVMDAASWSVFQEGFHEGFGADGDHLKTTENIDRMVKAGYTMFTIDPSDYVVNEVTDMSREELEKDYDKLPWADLDDEPEDFLERVKNEKAELRTGYKIEPTEEEILQGMVKYGRVIAHTRMMAEYLDTTYPDHPAELELSVDETDAPTTLFEHYLVASELSRLGVELVSLAPRFCGDFEKGIDFKGDLEQFRTEYVEHLAIADKFGGYKLSVHSGSDKFSVYEVVGSLNLGAVHVKTAGTSYLEALRTIAECEPDFFREIMAFSLKRFNEDKKTYHISAELDKVEDPMKVSEGELTKYLDDNHARQVLHVAYGSVLSGDFEESKDFKQRLMKALEENEDLHYQNLEKHFDKHLSPFAQ
ncbi:tagaturonate epimerase family protein [Gracilimonas mengyeensis]|uniref:Tagaturonate/fructuronate epimerase n=1 Tax=Gracilimonas mengyeensis TaxID=1302730 RepID=A0A521FDL3_9BACT|nr:tagaturonate epimerase family protein [Gracilimonas mengyeensis]SMO94219.1 tagaturonate epimerase [Gracilimonas mengyeensis]